MRTQIGQTSIAIPKTNTMNSSHGEDIDASGMKILFRLPVRRRNPRRTGGIQAMPHREIGGANRGVRRRERPEDGAGISAGKQLDAGDGRTVR